MDPRDLQLPFGYKRICIDKTFNLYSIKLRARCSNDDYYPELPGVHVQKSAVKNSNSSDVMLLFRFVTEDANKWGNYVRVLNEFLKKVAIKRIERKYSY